MGTIYLYTCLFIHVCISNNNIVQLGTMYIHRSRNIILTTQSYGRSGGGAGGGGAAPTYDRLLEEAYTPDTPADTEAEQGGEVGGGGWGVLAGFKKVFWLINITRILLL